MLYFNSNLGATLMSPFPASTKTAINGRARRTSGATTCWCLRKLPTSPTRASSSFRQKQNSRRCRWTSPSGQPRNVAFANRQRARAGGDPLAEKRHGQGMPTVEEAAAAVLEQQRPGWRNAKHARERISTQTARPVLLVPRSTLKNPAVFRSDMTRFVGRLEPREIERNPVLDLAP